MAQIILVEKDTAPLKLTYKVNGVAVDITGYGFTLKLKYPTETVSKPAVITDAPSGKFEFRPVAADLRVGTPPVEIMITFPDSTEKTQKFGNANILGRN